MINDHWLLIIPPRWDLWNIHPSVAAGLVLLGGLYVYLGGLTSARRHVASFFGALVVMFYMHLKFDNRFFVFLFGGPLLLALAVVVSLLFIFYGALRLRTGG